MKKFLAIASFSVFIASCATNQYGCYTDNQSSMPKATKSETVTLKDVAENINLNQESLKKSEIIICE